MFTLSFAGYATGVSTDYDGSGVVNFSDYARLADAWLTEAGGSGFNEIYDLNDNGVIDLADLKLFAQDWLGSGSYISPDTNRMQLSFNAGWKFYKGTVSADAASGSSYDDSSWLTVNVPHNPPKTGQSGIDPARPCWNDTGGYHYEGVSWYRKHFTLDNSYQGRKIFIEFEAINTRADVWVNGTLIPTTPHYGGYLPFTIDMTNYVSFGGADNVIAVKADNTDDANTPIGHSTWFNWGGIYRDAWLHITDKLHVTDAVYANTVAGGGIFVTYPSVSESQAQVQVKTHIKNEYGTAKTCTLKTYIVDSNNTIVAQMSNTQSISAGSSYTFTQSTTVTSPRLWHPDHPNFYTVYTEVYDDSIAVETYQTRIGIRRINFSHNNGFEINGQRLIFTGANRMQDYPYLGYAMSNSEQIRDAVKLREAGFQFIRTSQYPQDPAFLNACDELGMMVLDPIPGFQYFGGSTFQSRSYQNMRDMIRRDRNHPCVIAWELSLNETWWTGGIWNSYSATAVSIGHAEYPGDQCFVAGWKDIGVWGEAALYDIALRNPDHNPSAWDYTGPLPLIMNEYGHWRYGGSNSTSDVDRADGEAAMLVQARNHLESLNNNRGVTLYTPSGDALWAGIDLACYPSGVLDNFRIPKFSYYFYRSQRDPNLVISGLDSGPMVFIANYWTAGSPRDVNVFSNCEQVKLYRNGNLLATQGPDMDVNTVHLPHPPFTFRSVTFQSGELKAEGYIGGQLAATHIVKTPGSATSLDISFDLNELKVGGDITFVYVSVLDANGTVVPTPAKSITLAVVSGPATLASPGTVSSEAGIATFLLRSTTTPGLITVTATTSGLASDSAFITNQ